MNLTVTIEGLVKSRTTQEKKKKNLKNTLKKYYQ